MSPLATWQAQEAAPLTCTEARARAAQMRSAALSLRRAGEAEDAERAARTAESYHRLSRRLAQQVRDRAARIGRAVIEDRGGAA